MKKKREWNFATVKYARIAHSIESIKGEKKMRDCNKCIHHTSGSCTTYHCGGTVTVEDVERSATNKAIDLCIRVLRDAGNTKNIEELERYKF